MEGKDGGRKSALMAVEAALPEVRYRIPRLVVGIVACGAPHLPLAAARALAVGKLFRLADHPKGGAAIRRRRDVSSERAFERLTGVAIGQASARIQDPNCARQMAPLAHRIPLMGREFRGVHNRPGTRPLEMRRGVAMTATPHR